MYLKRGPERFSDQNEVNIFVDEALKYSTEFKILPIRSTTPPEVKHILDATGIDTSGFVHEISNYDLKHAIMGHGNASIEAKRGQLPITDRDLKFIPEIIDRYDGITKGSSQGNRQSIIYNKKVNGYVYYVEVVMPKQGVLRSKTMWKEPSAATRAMPEASPRYTSEIEPSLTLSADPNIPPNKIGGNGGQGENLKRAVQPPEIQALNEGIQKKAGPFTLGRVQHAPEAFRSPEFAAANELSKSLSGREIIPFKGRNDLHGISDGERVFLNANSKQPLLYVTSHELTHNIETASPETFARLNQIIREHIADVEGLRVHYERMGYAPEELPRELTADALAESMLEPTFWARVRQQAPELLKPILEALDRIISTFKQKVGNDMSIMPYLKDIETMRTRLADEYRRYLAEVNAGRGGKMDPAAKKEPAGNPGLLTPKSESTPAGATSFRDADDQKKGGNRFYDALTGGKWYRVPEDGCWVDW